LLISPKILPIISSKSELEHFNKIKKTEVITSAARLSALAQILGFAPPFHNGFAISEYRIIEYYLHKDVSCLFEFGIHLLEQRSKID
jgi:hypothetical protein